MNKYNVGDKVALADYKVCCSLANVLPTNEVYGRYYKYLKSKEPLIIEKIYEPNSIMYAEDDAPLTLRGRYNEDYLYNIHTPRSDKYLLKEEMLIPYIEVDDSESAPSESTI